MDQYRHQIDGQLADLVAVDWFIMYLIETSQTGPWNNELVKMNSYYISALETLEDYILKQPWLTVMESIINFREMYSKEYHKAHKNSSSKKFYISCINAADEVIEFLSAGYE